MDAVEFLDKVDRLSKRGSTEEKMRYNDYRTARDNTRAVKFVERWDAEHPIKTRQSEILKMFPGSDIDEMDGGLTLNPCIFYPKMREECAGRRCSDCRREFWLAEVEE
nr:MAG TPA: hypothetical protein [Caudoviricetes sp.]